MDKNHPTPPAPPADATPPGRHAPVLLMPPALAPAPAQPRLSSPKRPRSRVITVFAIVGALTAAGTAWLNAAGAGEEQRGVETRLVPDSAVSTLTAPAQPATGARLVSPTAEPRVHLSADGEYRLALPGALWSAIDAFLAPRPGLRLARWGDAGPDARGEMEAGRMQHPFAVWRDLDDDGD